MYSKYSSLYTSNNNYINSNNKKINIETYKDLLVYENLKKKDNIELLVKKNKVSLWLER
jgi:hypothetical protein